MKLNLIDCKQVLIISDHLSGKMAGVCGISTSTILNSFCSEMREAAKSDKSIICGKCYAFSGLQYKRSVREAYQKNEFLKVIKLTKKEAEQIAAAVSGCGFRFLRFESHGEIENEIQLSNYFKISRALKKYGVNCALWSKNYKVIAHAENITKLKKPSNLKIILSSLHMNNAIYTYTTLKYIDHIFSVFTLDYLLSHFNGDLKAINEYINCGGRCCCLCGKCYQKQKNAPFIINEMLKSDFKKYESLKAEYDNILINKNDYTVITQYNAGGVYYKDTYIIIKGSKGYYLALIDLLDNSIKELYFKGNNIKDCYIEG